MKLTPEQNGAYRAWYKKMEMINNLHPSKGLEEVDRILSPSTLILTEEDFEFLRVCGISSKGMILGQWR